MAQLVTVLKGLWLMHKPMPEHVHRQKDCGLWITHNGKEEMSSAEGAVGEKSEKEGMAERNHYVLTLTSCITHHFTERTECNLH